MAGKDLHIHSWYSDDGTYLPVRLVEMCAAAGISEMAIADHNTVRGVGEALEAAKRLNLRCHPAIEIDCTCEGTDLHVLGYDIAWQSPDYAWIEENVHRQAAQASRQMLEKLCSLGLPVQAEELTALARYRYRPEHWTGEMFAEVLLKKPALAEHPLLRPYRPGGARSDNPLVNFYWDWFAQGKPCHVSMHYPAAEEVIRIIHCSGGEAVLAHPGASLAPGSMMIETLATMGLDGVEAQSSYHSAAQAATYAAKAAALGLRCTCGSDFHGETKPAIRLAQFPALVQA